MINSNNNSQKTGMVNDVFNQLKTTAKTAGKQINPAQFVKTAGQQIRGQSANLPTRPNIEPPVKRNGQSGGGAQEVDVTQMSDQQFEQIKKQKQLQAMRQYKQIHEELLKYRAKIQQEIPKNIASQPGFDPDNPAGAKKPEGPGPLQEPALARKKGIFGAFGNKNKKKPGSQQQQNMGTGERRGVK